MRRGRPRLLRQVRRAAIDTVISANNPRRLVRCEEERELGDFLDLAETFAGVDLEVIVFLRRAAVGAVTAKEVVDRWDPG